MASVVLVESLAGSDIAAVDDGLRVLVESACHHGSMERHLVRLPSKILIGNESPLVRLRMARSVHELRHDLLLVPGCSGCRLDRVPLDIAFHLLNANCMVELGSLRLQAHLMLLQFQIHGLLLEIHLR